ncbi:hypothetical protein LENED_006971 [Lentinula edodes]|uniref:Uncharacterized protein n=1 Tax=Lentinula edodes TaxID=5353 RepID=A0A1Q3EDC4_LENED|nr:hypothetical protein LENED_006971 [Lentinula edodes]
MFDNNNQSPGPNCAQEYAEGAVDQAGGYKGSALGATKGDKIPTGCGFCRLIVGNWQHDQAMLSTAQQDFNR